MRLCTVVFSCFYNRVLFVTMVTARRKYFPKHVLPVHDTRDHSLIILLWSGISE